MGRFTEDELKFIRDNVGKMSQAKMAEKLGRSTTAVSDNIQRMKKQLDQILVYKKLTAAEESYIAQNMDVDNHVLGKILGCSFDTVRRRKRKIRLQESAEKLNQLQRLALGLPEVRQMSCKKQSGVVWQGFNVV